MDLANHAIYLVLSACFTICVGHSLFKHGRPFLVECLPNEKIADAVNMLFLVGFYLLNSAFVFLALRFGETGETLVSSVELLAGRVGFIALVMGLMHFFNLTWCEIFRNIDNSPPMQRQ